MHEQMSDMIDEIIVHIFNNVLDICFESSEDMTLSNVKEITSEYLEYCGLDSEQLARGIHNHILDLKADADNRR